MGKLKNCLFSIYITIIYAFCVDINHSYNLSRSEARGWSLNILYSKKRLKKGYRKKMTKKNDLGSPFKIAVFKGKEIRRTFHKDIATNG